MGNEGMGDKMIGCQTVFNSAVQACHDGHCNIQALSVLVSIWPEEEMCVSQVIYSGGVNPECSSKRLTCVTAADFSWHNGNKMRLPWNEIENLHELWLM